MELKRKIETFAILGEFLSQFDTKKNKSTGKEILPLNETHYADFDELIQTLWKYNGWFTENNVRMALGSIARSLTPDKLQNWLKRYHFGNDKMKTIAVIMAGNIPAVGFHDFACVLLSGNKFLGKTSSGDRHIVPFFSKVLFSLDSNWGNRISFTEGRIENPDAVIATGSANTSRYFEYYFGKQPNIIRKNRNSVAVLSGNETEEELKNFGNDIFSYFGLGCRNVSKIFVPEGYNFNPFFEALYGYRDIVNMNKYANNYEYNRTVYLMNSVKLLDNNFLLLKEDKSIASPVGVLYYEYYSEINDVQERLEKESSSLQCIVSSHPSVKKSIPFGSSQQPELWDYADGIDTMKFLSELN